MNKVVIILSFLIILVIEIQGFVDDEVDAELKDALSKFK